MAAPRDAASAPPSGTKSAPPREATFSAPSRPPQAPVERASTSVGQSDDDGEPDAVGPVRGASPTSEHDRWSRAVEAVRQVSPRHGKSLSFARFLGFTPEGARIAFATDAAFHRSQVVGMSRPLVESELSKALGRPLKLVEDSSPEAFQSAPRSIAEVEAADRATRERIIETKVREHPGTRAVLRHLGGSIEHIQVLESAPEAPAATPPADEPPEE